MIRTNLRCHKCLPPAATVIICCLHITFHFNLYILVLEINFYKDSGECCTLQLEAFQIFYWNKEEAQELTKCSMNMYLGYLILILVKYGHGSNFSKLQVGFTCTKPIIFPHIPKIIVYGQLCFSFSTHI